MLNKVPKDLKSVKKGLTSSDAIIRMHAARISRQFDYNFEKPLIKLLKDPFYGARVQSCISLARINSQEAMPLIIKQLKDESEECRWVAATSLGAYSTQTEPIIPLLLALRDLSRETREKAPYSLNEYNQKIVKNRVWEFFEQFQDEDVHQQTTEQIDKLENLRGIFRGLRFLNGFWVSQAIHIGLSFPDEEIQRYSLFAIGVHRFEEFIPQVESFLDSPDGDFRYSAISCLSKFTSIDFQNYIDQFVDDPFEWVRQTIAVAVASNPIKQNIPILEKLIKDSDANIRKACIHSLRYFEFDLVKHLYLVAVTDINSYVRQVAANSLGHFVNSDAKELIEILLDDPDDLVQISAQNTLSSLKNTKQ